MKIAFLLFLATLLGLVTIVKAQEDVGQVAFDFNGALWQGSSISDENQLRFIGDLNAFCAAMQVSVEPLSQSEEQWLNSVAPRDKRHNHRGVSLDQDDPGKVSRIWSSSAFVRESIIKSAGACADLTSALTSDFQARSISSRLGVLIYVIANLRQTVEALETAGRRGWLLANAPGWRVETEGRGWSETIGGRATYTIMLISAFLARNT